MEGWVVASIAGVAMGALIGSSATARAYIGPTLEFLRPLPASAVIPVAIAMFGLTPAMALGVIGFGSIWPMLLATVHGFAAVVGDLRSERFEFGGTARREHHLGALLREQFCRSAANSCTGTGHDGDFSCQALHVHSPDAFHLPVPYAPASESNIGFSPACGKA